MKFYVKRISAFNDELQHHGIDGQKWGVRNGPPYPLSKGKSNRDSVKEKGLEDIIPGVPTLKFLVGVTGSAVREKNAKKRVSSAKIDPKTGLPLKEKPTTAEEDMRLVNPARGSIKSDTSNNCGYCTLAYDMRRRGFDVAAKRTTEGTIGEDFYKKYYKNVKVNYVKPSASDKLKPYVDKGPIAMVTGSARHPIEFRKYQKQLIHDLETELSSQPNGARGYLGVTWKNGLMGHSMAYEIFDGKPYIVDAQIAKRKPLNSIEKLISEVQYARTDNATPNYDEIKKDGLAQWI